MTAYFYPKLRLAIVVNYINFYLNILFSQMLYLYIFHLYYCIVIDLILTSVYSVVFDLVLT